MDCTTVMESVELHPSKSYGRIKYTDGTNIRYSFKIIQTPWCTSRSPLARISKIVNKSKTELNQDMFIRVFLDVCMILASPWAVSRILKHEKIPASEPLIIGVKYAPIFDCTGAELIQWVNLWMEANLPQNTIKLIRAIFTIEHESLMVMNAHIVRTLATKLYKTKTRKVLFQLYNINEHSTTELSSGED